MLVGICKRYLLSLHYYWHTCFLHCQWKEYLISVGNRFPFPSQYDCKGNYRIKLFSVRISFLAQDSIIFLCMTIIIIHSKYNFKNKLGISRINVSQLLRIPQNMHRFIANKIAWHVICFSHLCRNFCRWEVLKLALVKLFLICLNLQCGILNLGIN